MTTSYDDDATTSQPADVGPATAAPNWCLPDAQPSWDKLNESHGGGTVATWTRSFPPNDPSADVVIQCEDRIVDGRVMRTPPRIHVFESPREGWDSAAAQQVARYLIQAVDVISAAANGEAPR